MKEQITFDDFDKVDIRVGTVISVRKNEKARKPSLVVEVDFGEKIGIKQSSAQITHYYNEENLKGKQVIGVCNFPEKNIAGVVSQVLILGSIDKEGKVILAEDCLIPISFPKSTSTTKDGFRAFSFFLTEMTVPTRISTLSKSSKVICSFI